MYRRTEIASLFVLLRSGWRLDAVIDLGVGRCWRVVKGQEAQHVPLPDGWI